MIRRLATLDPGIALGSGLVNQPAIIVAGTQCKGFKPDGLPAQEKTCKNGHLQGARFSTSQYVQALAHFNTSKL
jgi:hypothetical protein